RREAWWLVWFRCRSGRDTGIEFLCPQKGIGLDGAPCGTASRGRSPRGFETKWRRAAMTTEPIRPGIPATQIAKTFVKKIIPKRIRDELRALRQLSGYIHYPEVPFDNTYPWLNWAFAEIKHNASPLCKSRPQYIWGVAQGAALAKVLGETRI